MRIPALIASLAAFLASCHESEKSISVTETRELTLFDQKYPGNIKDYPPLGWRRIPGTQMRAVNYVAGPNEEVEIFMGNSGGGVLPNANRWLGQLGLPPKTSVDDFEKIEVLGTDAYLVEVSGDFKGGMGQPAKPDQAIMGMIRENQDEVLTLKMTGPKEAVMALREEFVAYAKALEVHMPQAIEDPESN